MIARRLIFRRRCYGLSGRWRAVCGSPGRGFRVFSRGWLAVPLEVSVYLIELETQHSAEAYGYELPALNEPVDGSDRAIEQPGRVCS